MAVRLSEEGAPPIRVLSHQLLSNMRGAGARKTFIVLREGKWDIPAYYNDGTELLDMHLAYLMMRLPYGPPFTLDQAYPFLRDATVLLGFPDMLFEPEDAFVHMLERQTQTGADVVLGVWPLQPPGFVDDRLLIDSTGRVRHIEVKSMQPELPSTWVIAAWTPTFTEFLHDHVTNALRMNKRPPTDASSPSREMIVGDVLAAAVESKLHVDTVHFPTGTYVDFGTPESLATLYSQS
jgi:glucose-1-phosphate thymidylyltransferase